MSSIFQGFVFLETYDLREYDPFLLSIKKPHYFKVIFISLHILIKTALGLLEVFKMCLTIYSLLCP